MSRPGPWSCTIRSGTSAADYRPATRPATCAGRDIVAGAARRLEIRPRGHAPDRGRRRPPRTRQAPPPAERAHRSSAGRGSCPCARSPATRGRRAGRQQDRQRVARERRPRAPGSTNATVLPDRSSVSAPTIAGTPSGADEHQASRITPGGTTLRRAGPATAETPPRPGRSRPATITIQMTNRTSPPAARSGARPAPAEQQRGRPSPATVVRTLLANREPNATSAARMAMGQPIIPREPAGSLPPGRP